MNGVEVSNDFTQLNVVPKLEDIVSDQTSQYLRKNITNGAYKNANHYLDVQFRLLREDFLKPLRDGVQNLRKIISDAKKKQQHQHQNLLTYNVRSSISKIESLSTYFDCSIIESVPSDNQGMAYKIRLSPDKANSIDWDASKKLMFGSLVCLSNDYFQKICLVGSICNRDPIQLRRGIVLVKFNSDEFNKQTVPFGKNFIMLEASAFFESYKHVLQTLIAFRRDGEKNFPFLNNIVYCRNKSMPMPKYLANAQINLK